MWCDVQLQHSMSFIVFCLFVYTIHIAIVSSELWFLFSVCLHCEKCQILLYAVDARSCLPFKECPVTFKHSQLLMDFLWRCLQKVTTNIFNYNSENVIMSDVRE